MDYRDTFKFLYKVTLYLFIVARHVISLPADTFANIWTPNSICVRLTLIFKRNILFLISYFILNTVYLKSLKTPQIYLYKCLTGELKILTVAISSIKKCKCIILKSIVVVTCVQYTVSILKSLYFESEIEFKCEL